MITPPTDFEGATWATSGAADGDPVNMTFLGLILLALLLGAVVYAALAWSNHEQKNKLLKIRQRKYAHIKKAADKANGASNDAEQQAAVLFETCRKHLPPASAEHDKILAALKKAAEGADIESPRLKVAKIDRSRMLEPPRPGYPHPQSAEIYVFDEVPPPVPGLEQRRERAKKAITGFFEYWVTDANGADMSSLRLEELHRIQKSFAIDLPTDPDSATDSIRTKTRSTAD